MSTLSLKSVVIYTDGACAGNPGPGGWGVVLKYDDVVKELSGYEADTTNNRMELMAAIQGLQALKSRCVVRLFTDSKYVQRGITEWIVSWKANGWRTRARSPVKNVDLWQELDQLSHLHQVDWQWVRGHDGCQGNERADVLARNAISNKNG